MAQEQLGAIPFFLPGPADHDSATGQRSRGTGIGRKRLSIEAEEKAGQVVQSVIFRALADVHPGSPRVCRPRLPPPAFIPLPAGRPLEAEDLQGALTLLGRSADGSRFAFLEAGLTDLGLSSIDGLARYRDLQVVDVSYNVLSDLSCLQALPTLLELNASHNGVSAMFQPGPGAPGLKAINLSNNHMTSAASLAAHTRLQSAVLHDNGIADLSGLEACAQLAYLDLSFNRIHEGLPPLRLHHLGTLLLDHNRITSLSGLGALPALHTLNLADNSISSLAGLVGLPRLQTLNLRNNKVLDMAELLHAADLAHLSDLNLIGNPIQEAPDYRLNVLFRLGQLTDLDAQLCSAEDKVEAVNLLDPPAFHTAAVDHAMHKTKAAFNPETLLSSTPASVDTPYPVLLLTGPSAEATHELRNRIVERMGDLFCKCVSTCALGSCQGRESGDLHYITEAEMEEAIQDGLMLQTCHIDGQLLGLSRQSVAQAASQSKVAVACVEAEAALTLRLSYLRPVTVYVPAPSSAAAPPNRVELYESLSEHWDHSLPAGDPDAMWTELSQGRNGPLGAAQRALGVFRATTAG